MVVCFGYIWLSVRNDDDDDCNDVDVWFGIKFEDSDKKKTKKREDLDRK